MNVNIYEYEYLYKFCKLDIKSMYKFYMYYRY